MLNSNIKEFNSFAESPKWYNSYCISHTHLHLLFLSETLYNIKSPAFWFLSSLFFYFFYFFLFLAVLGLRFVRGLPLVAASGDRSSSRCAGLSLSRPLPLRGTGSRRAGSVVVAHGVFTSWCACFLPTFSASGLLMGEEGLKGKGNMDYSIFLFPHHHF